MINHAIAERGALDPLLVGEHVFEPADGVRHVDAQRQDRLFGLLRQLHLAQHMRALVGGTGEQQQHGARVLDRGHDLLVVAAAHRDVARRHPAGDVPIFEIGDERLRRFGVSGGVADEKIVSHELIAPRAPPMCRTRPGRPRADITIPARLPQHLMRRPETIGVTKTLPRVIAL